MVEFVVNGPAVCRSVEVMQNAEPCLSGDFVGTAVLRGENDIVKGKSFLHFSA